MKPLLIVVATLLFIGCSPSTLPSGSDGPSVAETQAVDSNALLGTWDVALYFDPNGPPSATELVINAVNDDGTLEGSFYQSPFEQGRYTQKDGALIISVVTSDGSGAYNTSGRLYPDGRFSGQTFSLGRGFLMPWTAGRQ